MPEQDREKSQRPLRLVDSFGPSKDEAIQAILDRLATESGPLKIIEGKTVSERIDGFRKAGGDLTGLMKSAVSVEIQFEENPSAYGLKELRVRKIKRAASLKRAA